MPDEVVLDRDKETSILSVVAEVRPDVLINCGAFTQVDRCEFEVDLALLLNGTVVGWLADACDAQGSMLI